MNVLITGHLGYIRTLTVPALLEAGHVVTGIDTDFYELCTFGNELPIIPSLCKDIRD